MDLKLSPVHDGQTESGATDIPGIALRERDGQEAFPAVTLLDHTPPLLGNADYLNQLRADEQHQSDNYQVALVPRENRTGRNTRTPLVVKPILVLPLTWRELSACLRAGGDPSGLGQDSSVVRFGQVLADFSRMEVTRSEEIVALTAMEFKLLRFLVQNAGRVISRDEMLNEVWGYENYPSTRTVDNHILKLRQKLELDPAHPVHFRTVHRIGYKFVLEASCVVPKHKM